MSAQRTPGGIRYDTKARSTGRRSTDPTPTRTGGSGSEKLAAYKKATSRTSPAQTPKEYRQKIQTPRQTGRPPTDVSPMARAGVPPSPTPTPVTRAQPLSPSQITTIQQRYNVFDKSPITHPATSRTDIRGAALQLEQKAMLEGYQAGRGVELSKPSTYIYEKSKIAADKLQTRGQELKDTGYYASGYGLTSVGNVAQMAGMVPGGLETMAKRPDIIKPAIIAGGIAMPRGIATQVKEDPLQLVSDVAVTAGMFKVGSGFTRVAKTKVPSKVQIKQPFTEAQLKWSFKTKPKIQGTRGYKVVKQKTSDIRFDVEMNKIKAKQALPKTPKINKQKYSNIRFDIEMKKIAIKQQSKQGFNRFIADEQAQIQSIKPQQRQVYYNRGVTTRKSELIPSLEEQLAIAAKRTSKPATSAISKTNYATNVAGVVGFASSYAQKQIAEQIQTPEINQKYLQGTVQAEEQSQAYATQLSSAQSQAVAQQAAQKQASIPAQKQKTKQKTNIVDGKYPFPEIAPTIPLAPSKAKDKRKKTKMISKDMFYDVKAPIADWADFFGGFKK